MPAHFSEDGWFPFPSLHRGSSSGLTMLRTAAEHALVFLTQQAGSEKIFLLNPHDGAEMRSFDPERNDTIGSIAFDGRYLRSPTSRPRRVRHPA